MFFNLYSFLYFCVMLSIDVLSFYVFVIMCGYLGWIGSALVRVMYVFVVMIMEEMLKIYYRKLEPYMDGDNIRFTKHKENDEIKRMIMNVFGYDIGNVVLLYVDLDVMQVDTAIEMQKLA
eukprot:TRINITY_DN9920_c0_g1_i1.p1 TRINITY_DN9920_c0_g1~~TRINITY_DN9920_c0_g1_i1.p1  ORF type:complete len:120 (-),score=22.61 TRINITY_DN9920_c0_g1_i1:16-375(-)